MRLEEKKRERRVLRDESKCEDEKLVKIREGESPCVRPFVLTRIKGKDWLCVFDDGK